MVANGLDQQFSQGSSVYQNRQLVTSHNGKWIRPTFIPSNTFSLAHKSAPKWYLHRFSHFCVHHNSLQMFSMGQTTHKNFPFPLGIWTPYITHSLWSPPKSTLKTACWLVQCFCRAHERDQQTGRHTNRWTHRQTMLFLSVAIAHILCNKRDVVN